MAGLMIVKAITSFKFGPDVMLMMNCIQIAKTSTLIANSMNY